MRLIDSDKLKTHYAWWKGGTGEHNLDEMKEIFDTIVNLQPTVEAEPIVRCRECIHLQKSGRCDETFLWIGNKEYGGCDDFFCGFGERKTE